MTTIPAPAIPEPAALAPAANRRHITLLMLLFVYAMSLIDRQIMGVLIEPVKAEFGVSDTAMGLLTGLAFALVYSVLAVPFGRYADQANRRNFIAWCCAAWSAMTAVCGLAGSYWQLAFARVGVAVGEAGGTAPSLSMISDLYPARQRARAMSVFMLGPHLGTLVGLGLGSWIAHHYGWRSAFIWMGIPGIVAALLLRFGGIEPLRGAYDGVRQAGAAAVSMRQILRGALADRAFVRICLAGLLLGFAGYGIGIWNTAFLVRSHGLTLQNAGALVGVTGGVAAIIGALGSGWLCDRLARRDIRWHLGVPIVGTLLALPLGLAYLMYPAGDPWQLGGFLVPRAMAFSLLFSIFAVWWAAPSLTALSTIIPADRRATVIAVYNLMLTAVGGGLGPLTVGMLSDGLSGAHGVHALRWAMAAVMFAFLLAVLAFASALKPYRAAAS
ncbi:spinster family MFS transporter [Massilia niastensis]|uniref:spinster family MFS transporter n=1 Tax=Massilia niastensis TaxID=544911 RepID=UPI000360E32B|nr:MFS transporter [Massilia niastensis]